MVDFSCPRAKNPALNLAAYQSPSYDGAMFRLIREVRLGVGRSSAAGTLGINGYAGIPAVDGVGNYFVLQLAVTGPISADSGYLLNIKRIDSVVRERGLPLLTSAVESDPPPGPARLTARLFKEFRDVWGGGITLDSLRVAFSPFFSCTCERLEHPMVRVSQKFEFSAAHRLHNPKLSLDENRQTFGKCNNPHGHGHNYEVQVTLLGEPDSSGRVIDLAVLERQVTETVIDRYDHKNLNVELPEFRELNPTVEHIAMTIYRLLKPQFATGIARLASVTVWETPKTWCEYAE